MKSQISIGNDTKDIYQKLNIKQMQAFNSKFSILDSHMVVSFLQIKMQAFSASIVLENHE